MILSQLGRVFCIRSANTYTLVVGLAASGLRNAARSMSSLGSDSGDYFALAVDGEISAEIPKGYDTVVTYYERTNPEALSLLYDPKEDLREDEDWLAVEAKKLGVPVIKFGDMKAFPSELIRKRLG